MFLGDKRSSSFVVSMSSTRKKFCNIDDSLTFLRRFSGIGAFDGHINEDHYVLSKLIVEMALTESTLVHISPSKTAAAALMLAIRLMSGKLLHFCSTIVV
jgi:hypothetical protein